MFAKSFVVSDYNRIKSYLCSNPICISSFFIIKTRDECWRLRRSQTAWLLTWQPFASASKLTKVLYPFFSFFETSNIVFLLRKYENLSRVYRSSETSTRASIFQWQNNAVNLTSYFRTQCGHFGYEWGTPCEVTENFHGPAYIMFEWNAVCCNRFITSISFFFVRSLYFI